MFGVSERWPESQSPQYGRPRLSSKLRPNQRAGAKPRLCQSAAGSGGKTFTAGNGLHCTWRLFKQGKS